MSRVIAMIFPLVFWAVAVFASPVKTPETLTQLEFAQRLIDSLGWAEGLPEKPQERDYLAILKGKRDLSFEAEDCYDKKSDSVVIRNFPLFGNFSGDGWIHASTARTAVHFRVFIPVAGKYTFKVFAKGDDQLWSIAGKAFKLNAGAAFRESTLGEVNLTAGVLEFNAVIPPAGAIDSFALYAPDLHPVEPLMGWNFSAPLTVEVANEIVALLLGLEGQLPEDRNYSKQLIEAAKAKLPPEAILTDNPVYGRTLSAKWVRFPQMGATISIPFNAEQTGVYTLRVRALGEELTAGFDTVMPSSKGKPYLEWVEAGTFRLSQGLHTVNVRLPSKGGADAIEISRKISTAINYADLTKLNLPTNGVIKAANIEFILKNLQERFIERR